MQARFTLSFGPIFLREGVHDESPASEKPESAAVADKADS
jgi:hypothetical protein